MPLVNGVGYLGEPMYIFWIHALPLHLVPSKYETTHTKAPPTLGLTPNPGLNHLTWAHPYSGLTHIRPLPILCSTVPGSLILGLNEGDGFSPMIGFPIQLYHTPHNPELHHTRLPSIFGSTNASGSLPMIGSLIPGPSQSWAPRYQVPLNIGLTSTWAPLFWAPLT